MKTTDEYGNSYHDLSWREYMDACQDLGRKYDANWVTHGWAACDGVPGAVEMMQRGWPEGMTRAQRVAAPLVQSHIAANTPVPRWGWDVTGASYDMGEYLAGNPDCWLVAAPFSPRPVVSISVELTSEAAASPEAYMARGGALIALVQALQASEFAVRAWTLSGIEWGGRTAWTRVMLTDDGGGPLDMDRLAFAMGHPANARGVTYSLGYAQNGAPRRDGMIGWARTTCPSEWRGVFNFGSIQYGEVDDWTNVEQVKAWVAKTYKAVVDAAMGAR